MIIVKYECDETGQEMEVTMTLPESKEDACEVRIKFEPKVDDNLEDPCGIMGKLFKLFNPRGIDDE